MRNLAPILPKLSKEEMLWLRATKGIPINDKTPVQVHSFILSSARDVLKILRRHIAVHDKDMKRGAYIRDYGGDACKIWTHLHILRRRLERYIGEDEK